MNPFHSDTFKCHQLSSMLVDQFKTRVIENRKSSARLLILKSLKSWSLVSWSNMNPFQCSYEWCSLYSKTGHGLQMHVSCQHGIQRRLDLSAATWQESPLCIPRSLNRTGMRLRADRIKAVIPEEGQTFRAHHRSIRRYEDWIFVSASFTLSRCQRWPFLKIFVHYLLMLASRTFTSFCNEFWKRLKKICDNTVTFLNAFDNCKVMYFRM